ncbi:MAG: methyltransferase domain-containing protein [Candidatus Saccharimonadales bacterium]
MKYKYGSNFQQLISSPEKLQNLLVNCSFSGSFKAWEQRKAFIANSIHKDGTFLDIGCGNGFLLCCLQEWSEFQITPYGIDINEKFIEEAKELFPSRKDNFAALDAKDIKDISAYLPKQYDFIFFSSNWINIKPDYHNKKQLENLLNYLEPGGRFIVGFYAQDKDVNLETLKEFKSLGINFDKTLENAKDTNLVAWINKTP